MGEKEVGLYKRIIRVIVPAAILLAAFPRCASIMAPQGGPVDSLPPKIVAMTPPYGTLNFNARRIYIEFDEYIQLKDQQREFFTSPFMEKKPTLSIRKKGVQIDLKEDLLPDRTYSLNFGNSIADNNEGNILPGFRYVFSTGDVIDSMLMSGVTFNARNGDSVGNVFILFFEADSIVMTLPDSTLLNRYPDVVGRSTPNGVFIAENLKPVSYWIYAFEDNNSNMTYEQGVDRVGFLDSVYNPLHMQPFGIWFDTVRKYMQADPQVVFNLFTEEPFRRQNLTSSSRPERDKVLLQFTASYPQIDTLTFYGIDSSRVITEYLKPTRDSIAYWFDLPEDQLPDTIRGRIVYQQHDSLDKLVPFARDLKLGWSNRNLQQNQQNPSAAQNRNGQEPPEESNPFRVTVNAGSSINPEKHIKFSFDYPLIRVDKDRIVLENITTPERPVKVPFVFESDTLKIREWLFSADWKVDDKYEMMIPAGTFENIRGQSNDTLRAAFTIDNPDKFATVSLNVKGVSESKYIIQIVDERGATVLNEKRDVTAGTWIFNYITPGVIRIRIIEDTNGSGVWDAGSLLERRQSERVGMFVGPDGREEITVKVNWIAEFDVDMAVVFAPDTMERLQQKMDRINARLARSAAQQRNERNRTGNQNQPSGPGTGAMPIGGGLPGIR